MNLRGRIAKLEAEPDDRPPEPPERACVTWLRVLDRVLERIDAAQREGAIAPGEEAEVAGVEARVAAAARWLRVVIEGGRPAVYTEYHCHGCLLALGWKDREPAFLREDHADHLRQCAQMDGCDVMTAEEMRQWKWR